MSRGESPPGAASPSTYRCLCRNPRRASRPARPSPVPWIRLAALRWIRLPAPEWIRLAAPGWSHLPAPGVDPLGRPQLDPIGRTRPGSAWPLSCGSDSTPRDTKSDAGVRIAELTDIATTRLKVRIDGAALDDFVFPAREREGERTKTPHRGRSWLREQVAKLCGAAGVRVVPPHGLRGTLATALDRTGVRVADVAAALGHAGTRVTEDAYIRENGRTVVRMRDVEKARARQA